MYKAGVQNVVAFTMVNAADGSLITSDTGSSAAFLGSTNSGGTFVQASATNNPVHQGQGIFTLTLTSDEMDNEVVAIRPHVPNAVPQIIAIRTTKKIVEDLNDFDVGASSVNIGFVTGTAVTDINDFKASTTGLSTFVASTESVSTATNTVLADVRFVNAFAVTTTGDFKASLSGITAAFEATTVGANIVSVTGTAVTDVTDFHTSTSGLSTFDVTNDTVTVKDNTITAAKFTSGALAAIAQGILTEDIDGTIDGQTMAEMLIAFMSGKVLVTDGPSTRTFDFYKRGGGTKSYTIVASKDDLFEGQRSNEGTIV